MAGETCKARTLNGMPCSYKAKLDGYCMIHYKKIKANEANDANETSECSICQSEIKGSKWYGGTVVQCGHIFHLDCIEKWVYDHYHTTCPICREEIADEDGMKPTDRISMFKMAKKMGRKSEVERMTKEFQALMRDMEMMTKAIMKAKEDGKLV